MRERLIDVQLAGKVGLLRLNQPARLNALTGAMVEEMSAALNELVATVKVVVITGTGRAFCSAAALDEPEQLPPVDRSQRDFGAILETHFNPLMTQLRNLPIPQVTAARGAAAGAGASLALAGDLVVASETAYFLQAFARIGLVPDAGSTYLLTRTVGRVRAMELMLLADRLPARKALEWGLVNRVVSDKKLEEEAMALAGTLAEGPSVALG